MLINFPVHRWAHGNILKLAGITIADALAGFICIYITHIYRVFMDCELIHSPCSSKGFTLYPMLYCMYGCCSLTVSHWKPVLLCCKLDKSISIDGVKTLVQLWLVIWIKKSLLSLLFSKMKKYFEHLQIFTIGSLLPSTEFSSSFLHLFVVAQIYALTTCWIPRLLEWRRQMSSFWLAPIHALKHRFLMLEFERGSYSMVVNKHVNPSGFDTVLGWSCRQ